MSTIYENKENKIASIKNTGKKGLRGMKNQKKVNLFEVVIEEKYTTTIPQVISIHELQEEIDILKKEIKEKQDLIKLLREKEREL